jgi:GNAT superfamily N-acetyltransferase
MATPTKTQENIQIPEAPQIPGLRFRYFQGESDFPNIMEVFNPCKEADNFEYTMTIEAIAHNFEHMEHSNPYIDMIFAEIEGEPIAYSRVGWFLEGSGDYVYYALGWIKPEWRRKGLGTAILKHNERRIQEIAADHPSEAKKYFQNDHEGQQVGVAALLKANGYEEIRWGYRMTRPISDPLPEAALPPGLEVRPSTEAHLIPIWEAAHEAFSESWGFVPATEESYQRWISGPYFDPSLWKVAWDGDEVAGMVLNFVDRDYNQEYGIQRGWTDPICVRKAWRRRGLARALLVQSIQMFRQMGFDETALGVDTQNPNHALDLYAGVGYKMVRSNIVYRKPLA